MSGYSKFNRQGRAPSVRRADMVESLEQRQMLSAAVLAALNPESQNPDSQDPAGSPDVLVPYEADHAIMFAGQSVAAAALASTTLVTSSAAGNTSVYGTAVTFTATVAGTNPTGTVTFFDGATNLGAGTAGNGGTWTLQISSLRAGNHSITAVYGGDAGNAASTSAVRAAAVTARTVIISGVTAANKIYDGITAATLDFSGAVISGLLASDAANVTLTTTGAGGTFASKNAGTGIAVNVAGLALGGSAAANYTFVQPATTANITPKALTVTGIRAGDKVYDGTTGATITTSAAALSGVLPADRTQVALVKTNPVGTFANKNAGAGKVVAVSGLSLSGNAAGNYTLTAATTTATISPKVLSVTGVTAANKAYDGTTAAVAGTGAATLVGVLVADVGNVTVSGGTGTFKSASAGTGIALSVQVTLAGSAAGNYTAGSANTTANITPKALTVAGISATKAYDGTTGGAAGSTTGATLSGIVAADNGKVSLVSVAFTTAAFSSAAAGTVQLGTLNGLTLRGSAARNYSVTAPIFTAMIGQRVITVRGVTGNDKVYDGTATGTVNTTHALLAGVLPADAAHVALGGTGVETFGSAQAGRNLAVTVSGLTLTGTAALNYTLTQPSAKASITPKALTVTGITAADKIYDGTTAATLSLGAAALSGVVAGDLANVALSVIDAVGAFATKNVGTSLAVAIKGLAIGGSAAGNYTLTQPSTTARITARAVTVTGVTAADKVYDATTAAIVDASHAVAGGIISGDGVKLVTANATGTFNNKNVGAGKTVTIGGLTLSGAAAGNYVITAPTTTAAVTAKALTVTGITADKVYDGTTAATLNVAGAALSGVIAADAGNVTLGTGSAAAGAFASANAGTYTVAVTGLTITGSAASNYALTQPGVTAHITAKTLTVTGITAGNRAYTGDRVAIVDASGAALVGVVAGDVANVTLVSTGVSGLFADKNAGDGKAVAVSGLSMTGSAAGNYTLAAASTTANITPKLITMTGITSAGKTYDGTDAATLNTTGALITGVLASDLAHVTIGAATGTFADANAGNGKTVNIHVTLGGSEGGNYAVAAATTTASIATKALTVTGVTANDKPADGSTAATLNTGGAALSGMVAADLAKVTLVTAGATGAFSQSAAGTNLTVTVSGLAITGEASGNYSLTQPTTTASIT